ncbi:MAG: RCC1 domain-containing protein [Candidatus Saccharimonas sp.]
MESNSEQFGLRIRRKRTVLVYAAVGLFVLVVVAIITAQCLIRQTEALMPAAPSGRVKVDQANYRLYRSLSTQVPGTPLAAGNTAATLPQVGASFRVRVGVENKEELMSARQIGSGEGSRACAISLSNRAYCWGSGSSGQLGNNSTTNSSIPVAVNTTGVLAGKTIKQISAGTSHTCAIASDDKAYCWGAGSSGQLGNSSTTNSLIPVAVNTTGVLAGKTIKQISAYGFHTCAVASDNKAYCWGRGDLGQLGNNSTTNSSIPVAVNTTGVLAGKTIKQISAGSFHTCAIASDNKAYCWGRGTSGQLGNNLYTNSSIPVAVNTTGVLAGKTIKQISNGSSHTCAIASDDKAYCWGSGSFGALGNNSAANSSVPVRVYAPKENTTIAANAMKLRTQYAKKTAATCQAVAAGWQDVTNGSALAYSAAGPNSGTAITAMTNNPGLPPTSVGYSYQSIVRPNSAAQLTFTNNREINAGETGLWDLALTDNGLERNTNYCIRLAADTAAAPGTSIDTYSYYPEFKTADGSLGIRFANAANATLANPTTGFSAATTSRAASTTTAKLSNNSSQQIEIANSSSTTGWSVSLAAAGGSTAKWTQNGGAANYAFNNSNANQGQLSVDMSSSTFTASGSTPLGQACTTAGLSYGAGGAFVAGTASANAITLATASSSSGLTCLFKLQNISLKQTVPAYQKPGTYTLPVTVTVVAQ